MPIFHKFEEADADSIAYKKCLEKHLELKKKLFKKIPRQSKDIRWKETEPVTELLKRILC